MLLFDLINIVLLYDLVTAVNVKFFTWCCNNNTNISYRLLRFVWYNKMLHAVPF